MQLKIFWLFTIYQQIWRSADCQVAGKLFSVHADEMKFTGTILGEDISIPALQTVWPKDQLVDMRSWISQHMRADVLKLWLLNLRVS